MEINKVVHGGQTSQNETNASSIKYNIKALETNQEDDLKGEYAGVKQYTKKELEEKIKEFNKCFRSEGVYAEFEVHNELDNKIMIKLVDKETDEVINEIPPHQIVDMIAEFMKQAGIIVDKKV